MTDVSSHTKQDPASVATAVGGTPAEAVKKLADMVGEFSTWAERSRNARLEDLRWRDSPGIEDRLNYLEHVAFNTTTFTRDFAEQVVKVAQEIASRSQHTGADLGPGMNQNPSAPEVEGG